MAAVATKPAQKVGSFRSDKAVLQTLPKSITDLLFAELGAGADELVESSSDHAELNAAAFGRPYKLCAKLAEEIRNFSQTSPDQFWDRALHPLIEHSYDVASNFFGTNKLLFVPNATFGLKAVLDGILDSSQVVPNGGLSGLHTVAYLAPLYGATKRLLTFYHEAAKLEPIVEIGDSLLETDVEKSWVFCESAQEILKRLDTVYEETPFTILIFDEVSSLTGRILPMDVVVDWAWSKNIKLIVDGTQVAAGYTTDARNKLLDKVDYYLTSTHKWLGNVKTCGVIRLGNTEYWSNCAFERCYPRPPAISFGWQPRPTSIEINKKVKQDDFRKYPWGRHHRSLDSATFSDNGSVSESEAGSVDGMAFKEECTCSAACEKTFNDVRNEFSWLGMGDFYIAYITLARALDIFTKHGENQLECAANLLTTGIKSNKFLNFTSIFSSNQRRCIDLIGPVPKSMLAGIVGKSVESLDVNNIQTALEDKYGLHVSVKRFDIRESGDSEYFFRVSAWSNTKAESLERLGVVLSNNLSLSSLTDAALKTSFLASWERYEELFSSIKPEAYFYRAEKLRHHLIFYYGHTACFYINKLVAGGFIRNDQRINPLFEGIFAVGVDEMSWDDIMEDNYHWNGLVGHTEMSDYLNAVIAYREQVKQFILKLLTENQVDKLPIEQHHLHWIILMGIQHESIHIETSACIIAQMPSQYINYTNNWQPDLLEISSGVNSTEVPANYLVSVPPGEVKIGKDYLEDDLYGWDNEFGGEVHQLDGFKVSAFLVSNAEYLEFINDGGYRTREYWCDEGWSYVYERSKHTAPWLWIHRNGTWYNTTILYDIPMPWDHPVECNNLEAAAFCRWKSKKLNQPGLRLLSHREQFHLRNLARSTTANINLKHKTTTSITEHSSEVNGERVFDVIGNVWRHSCSVLTMMPGAKLHPTYDDFSLPTIDGQHNHILGGSFISVANCAAQNARFGFRRHFWQFAGIRYVVSDNDFHSSVPRIWNSDPLGHHISAHFGPIAYETVRPDMNEKSDMDAKGFKKYTALKSDKLPEFVDNWHRRFGTTAASWMNSRFGKGTVKLLTCHGSVGGSLLEIMQNFNGKLVVDHTDPTANTLQVLQYLLETGSTKWQQQLEGNIEQLNEYRIESSIFEDINSKNISITYSQADYDNLRPHLHSYDCIVADFNHQSIGETIFSRVANTLNPEGIIILGSIESPQEMAVYAKSCGFHCIQVLDESMAHATPIDLQRAEYTVSYVSMWKRGSGEACTVMEPTYKFNSFGKVVKITCDELVRKYSVERKCALCYEVGDAEVRESLSNDFVKVSNWASKDALSQNFDVVVLADCLTKIDSPKQVVKEACDATNGFLVIFSSNDWCKDICPEDEWVGGFKSNSTGENVYTDDGLAVLCGESMDFLECRKVPCVTMSETGVHSYRLFSVMAFMRK